MLRATTPRQLPKHHTLFGNNEKIHALIELMSRYNMPLDRYTNHPKAIAHARAVLLNESINKETRFYHDISSQGINQENLVTLGHPDTGLWAVKYQHDNVNYIIVNIIPDEKAIQTLVAEKQTGENSYQQY